MEISSKSPVAKWFIRFCQWFGAHPLYRIFNWSIDYFVYPAVLATFGLVSGAVIMMAGTFFLDYGTVIYYSWLNKDIFGLEELKELKQHEKEIGLKKFFGKIMKKGDWAVYIFLVITSNPFMVTAYFRSKDPSHRKPGQHMTSRDWKFFLSSFFISHAIWIGILSGIWVSIKAIWFNFFVGQ